MANPIFTAAAELICRLEACCKCRRMFVTKCNLNLGRINKSKNGKGNCNKL